MTIFMHLSILYAAGRCNKIIPGAALIYIVDRASWLVAVERGELVKRF